MWEGTNASPAVRTRLTNRKLIPDTAAMAAYGDGFVALLGAIFVIGAVANTGSLVYIRRTFPTRTMAIFFIAYLDSIVSLSASVLSAIAAAISLHTNNGIFCTTQYAILFMAAQSGLLMTTEIAVIRCWSVILARRCKKLDERAGFRVAMAVLLLQFALITSHITYRSAVGESVSLPVDLCMGRKGAKARLDLFRCLFILWIGLTPLISLVSDVTIIFNMRRVHPQVKAAKNIKKADYTIPIYATVISVAFTIFAPAIPLIGYRFDVGTETSNAIGMAMVASLIAFRCPLVTALTFSAKVRTDQESKAKRQDREREWAKQQREERLKKMRKVRFLLDSDGSHFAESTV